MYMFKYICKRIGLMLMTFAIIFVTCFTLIRLLPINTSAGFGQDTDKVIRELINRGQLVDLGNGKYVRASVIDQFKDYATLVFTEGDFGVSYNTPGLRNKSVWGLFIEKLPPTILINIYSSLFSVPIGIALGIFAALKKNKWQDHFISTAVMVVISVPSFVYASLLLYTICFKVSSPLPMTLAALNDIVKAYPDKNYVYTELTTNWPLYFNWKMFRSMIPPILAMSFGSIAGYTRFVRAELTEVLTSEFMLLARTKGLTKSQATLHHALRNSMVPIFPSIVGEFISVLSGSLVIEKIFGIPGVGGIYLQAINNQDLDLFMLLSGFYLLVGLAAGLVIDLSYGVIDPRIRMGAK